MVRGISSDGPKIKKPAVTCHAGELMGCYVAVVPPGRRRLAARKFLLESSSHLESAEELQASHMECKFLVQDVEQAPNLPA